MAGRRGRKARAIEQIKTLKRDYRQKLLQSATFIVTTGSEKDVAASLATEKFECFSANPNAFYENLADRIPEALWKGKESMVNLFDVIGRHLYDMAVDLDLNEYDQLIFKQEHYVSIKTKADLVTLLKKAINSQVGAEIVGIQAVTSIVDKAIERSHAKIATPIVLATDDEALAIDLETSLRRLKPRGVFLVVAGKGTKNLRAVPGVISVKEPTEETMKQALNQISGAIKK
ncbi:unnamed protein product [Sphagnum jensenii]|uniref:Uncharacterized protein n=1 Tax=Sphagnum jensenii TaxID=128206 RepID=A0ABP0VFG9_9BRYO